jgi:hypothetical protein
VADFKQSMFYFAMSRQVPKPWYSMGLIGFQRISGQRLNLCPAGLRVEKYQYPDDDSLPHMLDGN